MSLSVKLAIGIMLAAGLAYFATPVAILAARRFAFYDKPVGYKGHGRPTPYLGGTAVMLAFALAVLVGTGTARRTLPLLAGVIVLLVLGTIDDRRTVSPALRAGVELALGALLSSAGLGWKLGAGSAVDAAVTGLWVVAVVNSFNLFDNMDGAASTMAAVVAAAACALAISTGATWAAVGSAALCGACLGFLPHNLLARPARIFLGDGGSMPLGFAVAMLVAEAARSAESSTLSLLVGFLLVGVPALDTCLVVVSRRRRGISILTGGQDHLTHRTRRRVQTASRVALVLGSAQALLSALVVVAIHGTPTTLVYVLLAFVVAASATIGALESVEASQTAAGETTAVGIAAGETTATDLAAGESTARTTSTLTAPAAPRRRAMGASVLAPNPGRDRISYALLGVLGLGAGLSPLFQAYYGTGVWTPIGLGVIVVSAIALVARPPRLGRPAVVGLCAVAGLGLWSLISTLWTPTVEQATIDANRWLVYSGELLLAIVLIRGRRHALALLGAAGAGLAITAIVVVIRLLGAGGPEMFVGGRLDLPLGYINGQGCAFALACWLALALAERRHPVAAGAGAAGAVVLACLTLMSQSRGAAIALLVSLLVAVAAFPGRRRRLIAVAVVAGGVAAAAGDVLRIYSASGAAGVPTAHALHTAVGAMFGAGAAAGLVWGALAAFARLGRRGGRSPRSAPTLSRLATAAAIAVVAVPMAAGVLKLGSIERSVSHQWHAFVHLSDAASNPSAAGEQTRLLSGAGNRYDYWRIAWHLFTAHPIAGAGAGGYTVTYYERRRTTEAIENPHSVELELLSELGLVGGLLLLALIVACVLGARQWARAAARSASSRTVLVAATGVALTWLVDTSGDWMHLLPGVSAIALAAVAVLCHPQRDGTPEPSRGVATTGDGRRPRVSIARVVAAALVGFVLALAGASLMRTGLAQIYLDDAQSALARNPRGALVDANRALRLDGANLSSYYVKAAALARFDQAEAARAVLLQAVREQPTSFVTWTLLGDLEVRAGHPGLARRYYAAAHRLDPNDPALADLVADPESALGRPSAR